MTENEIGKIGDIFKHQLGIFAEDVQHKFDLLIEGQQSLVERIDRMEFELKDDVNKIDRRLTSVDVSLSKKIDNVAESLDAHRRDTEVHRGYQVRED